VWIDTSELGQEKMPSHWLCGDVGDWVGTQEEATAEAAKWSEMTGHPCVAKFYARGEP
jgi:hypothetical protein